MPKSRMQERFQSLPMYYKLVGAGAFITLIGAFLPWYNDIDRFQKGVQFSGVTGPLYLVGYIMIAIGVFSLILTSFHFLDKKIPNLPIKESQMYIIASSFALFLLILTNSVFFHHQFGMNAIDKGYQYGMIISFIGVFTMLAGGIIQSRERGTSRLIREFQEETIGDFEEEEDEEPNNFQREIKEEKVYIHEKPKASVQAQSGVREYKAKPEPEIEREREKRPVRENLPYRGGLSQETTVRREPFPDPNMLRKESQQTARPVFGNTAPKKSDSKEQDVNPNTVIRMDL